MKPFLLLLPLLFLGCQAPSNRPLAAQTMIAHWANYAHEDYPPFVREAQPDLVQVGLYGGH